MSDMLISTAIEGLLKARIELIVNSDPQLACSTLTLIDEMTGRYSPSYFQNEELNLILELVDVADHVLTTHEEENSNE